MPRSLYEKLIRDGHATIYKTTILVQILIMILSIVCGNHRVRGLSQDDGLFISFIYSQTRFSYYFKATKFVFSGFL